LRSASRSAASRPAHLLAAASSLLLLLEAACGTGSAGARVGEPAVAPPASAPPAGRVVQVGNRPEGIAVDPFTTLLAYGPARLAPAQGRGRLAAG